MNHTRRNFIKKTSLRDSFGSWEVHYAQTSTSLVSEMSLGANDRINCAVIAGVRSRAKAHVLPLSIVRKMLISLYSCDVDDRIH